MSTGSEEPTVAYFCMEYGLHESLPIFSGGLGVLAGDTMKAAGDHGRPMVGVGLFWAEGYTAQHIGHDGHPYDVYPKTPRSRLIPVDAKVSVEVGEQTVPLVAWRVVGFGTAPLYLLEPEREEDRWLTNRLYHGSAADRVAQEIVLGVGGVRLLRALGVEVDVYHFNEGHALFAGFELLREEMARGTAFEEACERIREHIVFTTHTPVDAGNERHPIALLKTMRADLGTLTEDQLETLGGSPFNMTAAALRLSRAANAVAQLHGETARRMWAAIDDAAPIVAITNGVHMPTWQDGRIRETLGINGSDDQLWTVKQGLKRELVREVAERNGVHFDPAKLLIGFARRAATYKRATLILRDLEWLEPLLADKAIQIAFAGKAHPQDEAGKAVVREIVHIARRYPHAIVFLENYDMHLGRLLTRGCDVWLNTPKRPMEASGTSGMKAAANGVLNVSTLDGWWDEACQHGVNGWQFGDAYEGEDQDAHDLRALQVCLSEQVVPTWYGDRTRWIAMMRAAIETAAHTFSAGRMVRDYYEQLYRPTTPGPRAKKASPSKRKTAAKTARAVKAAAEKKPARAKTRKKTPI